MEQNMIKLYDPANAKNLNAEQLAAMANFTNDDLLALAKAYPNKSTGNAYLILGNTKLKEQFGNPSTFTNLYNLRVRQQQKHFFALSYRILWRKSAIKPTVAKLADLTKEELAGLPGISGKAAKAVADQISGPGKADEQTAKPVISKAENDAEAIVNPISSIPDPNAEPEFEDLTEDATLKAEGTPKQGSKKGKK